MTLKSAKYTGSLVWRDFYEPYQEDTRSAARGSPSVSCRYSSRRRVQTSSLTARRPPVTFTGESVGRLRAVARA